MRVVTTPIPDLLIIEPKVFGDYRVFFYESFNERRFIELTGLARENACVFVQDNQSMSAKHVLRGLHYQIENAQGKLVRVVSGEVYDVAVDIRRNSPTFGNWFGLVLSAENKRQLWIPPGFAHGFVVTSESAEALYKTTEYWAPEHERCILWNDPEIGIEWPIMAEPLLSAKDKLGKRLSEAEVFA